MPPRSARLRGVGLACVVAASAAMGCGGSESSVTGPAADRQALGAAHAAVDAWGSFAASGRLAEAAPHFHKGGPQYLRFEKDAARVAEDVPAPTRLRLTSAGVVQGSRGNELRVVRGTVVVSRSPQPDRSFPAEIMLFRAPDGRWRVWTVRDMRKRKGPVPAVAFEH